MLLKTAGMDPYQFFSKRVWTGSHDGSILSVLDDYVVGEPIRSLVFDQMPSQIKEQLRIIHRSPDFGMPPIVTPANVNGVLREKVKEVLVPLHRDANGRKFLSDLRIDQFQIGSHSQYESVDRLVLEWETI